MIPGTWLKHYSSVGGRIPTYFEFMAELPYIMASGATTTLRLESGTVLQVTDSFVRRLSPREEGDPLPKPKITAKPKWVDSTKLEGGGGRPITDKAMAQIASGWPRLMSVNQARKRKTS
jgi:hypothetical protein